ncbi:MAG: hypothetical protein WBX01_03910 [Nitrososphaeraceae archaeon]
MKCVKQIIEGPENSIIRPAAELHHPTGINNEMSDRRSKTTYFWLVVYLLITVNLRRKALTFFAF